MTRWGAAPGRGRGRRPADRGHDRGRGVAHGDGLHPVGAVAHLLDLARRHLAQQRGDEAVARPHDVGRAGRRSPPARTRTAPLPRAAWRGSSESVVRGRHRVMRDAEAAEEHDARDAGGAGGGGHRPRALDVDGLEGLARRLGADLGQVDHGRRARERRASARPRSGRAPCAARRPRSVTVCAAVSDRTTPATSQPSAVAARHDVPAHEAAGAGDGEARHVAYQRGGGRPRAPAPLRARPGVAPVCSPSRRTGTPLTSTWRMPTAYWCGCS